MIFSVMTRRLGVYVSSTVEIHQSKAKGFIHRPAYYSTGDLPFLSIKAVVLEFAVIVLKINAGYGLGLLSFCSEYVF